MLYKTLYNKNESILIKRYSLIDIIIKINFFYLTIDLFLFLFLDGLLPETKQLLCSTSKKKGKSGSKGGSANEEEPKADSQPVNIHLYFKRYVFDPHKKMVQSWLLSQTLDRGHSLECWPRDGSSSEVWWRSDSSHGDVNIHRLFFLGDWDNQLKLNDCGMLNICETGIVLFSFKRMDIIPFAPSQRSMLLCCFPTQMFTWCFNIWPFVVLCRQHTI